MNIIKDMILISDQFGTVPCILTHYESINILVKTDSSEPSILSLYLRSSKFTGHQIPHEYH